MMTNEKFILFLCNILWEDLADGDIPSDEDWKTIRNELFERGLDPDEIFPY